MLPELKISSKRSHKVILEKITIGSNYMK